MTFHLSPEIKEKFPHVKIGLLIVRGANNHTSQPEVLELFRKEEEALKKRYSLEGLSEIKKIQDWRGAYKAFGFKPNKFRSSIESLIRRVLQGKELPDINPLINLYHLISLRHALAVGSVDLDKIEGTISLTIADGSEPFQMLKEEESISVEPGEVIYRDEKEVLRRGWNYRECEKSKITHETSKAAFILEGLENTTKEEIKLALFELKTLIEKYCGGVVEEHVIMGSNLPTYHTYEDFQTRSEKLKKIRDLGMDPYPHSFELTHKTKDLISKYGTEPIGTSNDAEEEKTPEACLAGRLILFRAMGKNCFGQIQDGSHRIQVMFNTQYTQVSNLPPSEKAFQFIQKMIDLGDIIGIKGHLFRTQKGEITLYAKEVTLLCKTLLPLAHKFHGLTDKGTRYRKRWLDLISHPKVIDEFKMRSQILKIVRRELESLCFDEVETPILQNIYGGAEARPFVSHLNALNQDMFLRIALEIALKKLIVGGMDRIYEIGKVFRNEGIDRTHNPEFTMLEAYAAYWDYNDVMDFTEHLFEKVALELFGTTEIGIRKDKKGNEHPIDLKRPWIRISMKESIKKYAKIDVDTLSIEEMKSLLREKSDLDGEKFEKAVRGKLIALLFEELVEHHLIQPHHITDHPIETTPLCKLHRNPKERSDQIVERFETFILGTEFCNAYSELNDPELQRSLLEEQAKKKEAGDDEANPLDEEFIEAICQGMPPTGGLGVGIDRMTMLFTNAESIRDVLYFPLMRLDD
ncbi:MAG: lysine--tRNA ligase [Simkaniaceae bacterium]